MAMQVVLGCSCVPCMCHDDSDLRRSIIGRLTWVVVLCAQKCCICPNVEDKALTPTTDGRWVHVACAYWHSQPCFVDADKREPVDLVAVPLEKERLKLVWFDWARGECLSYSVLHLLPHVQKCVYCKKTGACLQCECKRCRRSYHGMSYVLRLLDRMTLIAPRFLAGCTVPCGLRSGCKFEIRPSATDADDIEMHTFCNKHVDMVRQHVLILQELVLTQDVISERRSGPHHSIA